jgi:hypothetical protein
MPLSLCNKNIHNTTESSHLSSGVFLTYTPLEQNILDNDYIILSLKNYLSFNTFPSHSAPIFDCTVAKEMNSHENRSIYALIK